MPEDELLPLEALTIRIQQQGRQTFDVGCLAGGIFHLQPVTMKGEARAKLLGLLICQSPLPL